MSENSISDSISLAKGRNGKRELVEHHSHEECRQAVAELAKSEERLAKVYAIAEARSYALHESCSREDLVHDAVARLLDPTNPRKWPKDICLLTYLSNTIRSDVSNRNSRFRTAKNHAGDISGRSHHSSNIECAHDAAMTVERIEDMFSEDADVLKMLKAKAEGHTGEDMWKIMGGKRNLDAARKRFSRRLPEIGRLRS